MVKLKPLFLFRNDFYLTTWWYSWSISKCKARRQLSLDVFFFFYLQSRSAVMIGVGFKGFLGFLVFYKSILKGFVGFSVFFGFSKSVLKGFLGFRYLFGYESNHLMDWIPADFWVLIPLWYFLSDEKATYGLFYLKGFWMLSHEGFDPQFFGEVGQKRGVSNMFLGNNKKLDPRTCFFEP